MHNPIYNIAENLHLSSVRYNDFILHLGKFALRFPHVNHSELHIFTVENLGPQNTC